MQRLHDDAVFSVKALHQQDRPEGDENILAEEKSNIVGSSSHGPQTLA